MSLTKVNTDVLYVPELSTALVADTTVGGVGTELLKRANIVNANFSGKITVNSLVQPVMKVAGINLLPNSGRFIGGLYSSSVQLSGSNDVWANGIFGTFNSSTFASAGKFTHDNTTYGGARGALNTDVDSLIIATGRASDSNAPRYGTEFYITKITQGASASAPSPTGHTSEESLAATSLMRMCGYCQWSAWIKVLSGSFWSYLPTSDNSAGYEINGVYHTDKVIKTNIDGWFFFSTAWKYSSGTGTTVMGDFCASIGYDNAAPYWYLSDSAQMLVAMPALVMGVDVIKRYNSPLLSVA